MEHSKTDRFVSPLWVTIWENGIEGGPECLYEYAAEYEPCIRRALREFLFQNFQSDDLMPRLSLPDEPEMEAALRAKVHTARLSTCTSEDRLYAAVELELSSSLTPEEQTSFEEALERQYNGVFGEEVELLKIFTEQGVELCARLCHDGLEFFYQEAAEFRQAGPESPSQQTGQIMS